LFERVARPEAAGAGIGLAANGLAVLDRLGLLPAIEAASCEVGAGRVVTGDGRVLFQAARSAPRIRMIRRSTLQQILLDALAGEPRIDMQFGVEVRAAARNGQLDLGLGGPTPAWDLVVGADGVHSRVRRHGAFGARVSAPGIGYLRAIVPGNLARNEEAWTRAGLFGSFPVPDGTYIYASMDDVGVEGDLKALQAAWDRAYQPAADIFRHLRSWSELIVTRVVRVDCDRWVDGRVAILGDAAHAMAPNLGQGGNSALVDAAVLVDELRQAADLPTALSAWEARRRPKVRAVADMADRLGRLAEITNPAARWVRDRVLPPLARAAARRNTEAMVLQEPLTALSTRY
jgi:2-polyprenyl-6-methoxyphenol hydroxylase-like FAD-dependent oxidoreductase